MNIEGKVALITGAAGTLGQVLARRFSAAGASVALTDYKPDRLNTLLSDLPNALLIADSDARDPVAADTAVSVTLERFGRIDILINNVGHWRGGKPGYEVYPALFDELMATNARSMMLMTSAVAPHMIAQGGGKIVSVGASGALEGKAGSGVYAATKAAVMRLTESFSRELKVEGINVNCVLPGIIDSAANREMRPKADPGKWVTPEALSDVIQFLASDAARGIHGASIPVFGLLDL